MPTSSLSQNQLVKEISRSPLGSIQITYTGLQEAVLDFLNLIIPGNKKTNSFSLKNVEFLEFQHNTNFQVNIFLDLKSKAKLNLEFQKQIQDNVIAFLANEFKIETLSVNIIFNLNN